MIIHNNEYERNKDIEQERQINQLINLVEKQTRSKRHLELNGHKIRSQENLERAQELQMKRQVEIEQLKVKLRGEKEDIRENLERRFLETEDYLNHNAQKMDDRAFYLTKEKQERRKEQLDRFE